MSILSHFQTRLSIGLLLGSLAIAGPASIASAAAPVSASPYFGRFIVDDDNPKYSERGRQYKMIDIAPCNKDFCGVSVSNNGACGPVLFRFLSKRLKNDKLQGHAKWGSAKKNVVIYSNDDPETAKGDGFTLYVGDGYDFGDRSDNMPKFQASYKRLGRASCRVG